MLEGVAWALLIATLNSGVTGTVTINGTPAAGITVHREAAETVSDAKVRFYLAAVGWPGEAVILEFESDGDLLGSRPATVGATQQTFTFVIDGFGEDISRWQARANARISPTATGWSCGLPPPDRHSIPR